MTQIELYMVFGVIVLTVRRYLIGVVTKDPLFTGMDKTFSRLFSLAKSHFKGRKAQ